MAFEVLLADEAEKDIEDIWRYVAERESIGKADRLLNAIEGACAGLSVYPARGNVPKELAAVGMREFLEAHCGPYRIVYRLFGRRVIVYCVVDGRRDMQSLLQRRLLR